MTDKLVTDLDTIDSNGGIELTDWVLVARTGAPKNYKGSINDLTTLIVTQISGDLATVATSGHYSDLIGLPSLGSMAAQNSTSVSITGGTITGMPTPSGSTDVANKAYVDAATSGLASIGASTLATTGTNLTATYSNGSSGIGATLTNSGSLAALVIDSVTVTSGMVILVKDQTAALQNGVYTVTTVGDGSTAWVLTRATTYDTTGEIVAGSYTIIESGTINAGTLWVNTVNGSVTVGTTAIVFTSLGIAAPTLTFTGNVTGSGSSTIALTIPSNTVSNAQMAQMAAHTYKGNNTGSTANPSNVTAAQLTSDLSLFTSLVQGVVPASGGGNQKFLRSDGTWATGPGGDSVVVGPVTSVNNSVATWSGTTGGQLLSSPMVVDLSGNITGINSITIPNSGLYIIDPSATYTLQVIAGTTQSANRTLTIDTLNTNAVLTVSGTTSVSGTNSGDQTITLTGNVTGTGTGSFATTIASHAVTTGMIALGTDNTLAGYDGSGNFSGVTVSTGLSLSGGVLTATGSGSVSTTGSPSSGNITVFSGGTSITNGDLSGDITTSGTTVTTLANVNANTGSFGSSTSIPTFTVNSKGLLTAAGSAVVIAPASTLSGTTLNSSIVSSSLTSVGTLTSGTWNGTILTVSYGGTGVSLASTGGTSQVLKQTTSGGNISVGQLSASDISGLGSLATQSSVNAGALTGTTLSSGVVTSSLTSVGTLANLTVTNAIVGSVNGNAGTVSTISGLISASTNITITGSGTSGSPYSISSSGGSSTTSLAQLTSNVLFDGNNNINLGNATGMHTSAVGNTFVGNTAGNPSGSTSTTAYNTAVGYESQNVLTSGYRNTSVGYGSMLNATTDSYSVAIGVGALTNAIGGSQNIGIGYSTTLSGINDTNEIIIGYNLGGNGSNTATIGNSSCTDVYFGTPSTTVLHAKSSNIGSLISAGSNITITGSGTTASPYSIAASAAAGMSINSQSTAYTTVLGDANGSIYHPSSDTTARTFTIAANSSVAYPVGTALTFINDVTAGTLTIAITSDTLVLLGTGSTGSRTLTAAGVATAIKVTSTRWVISGINLT